MSTPDDFESESGEASSDAGVKHYQIRVPGFQEVGAPSGVTIPSKFSDGTNISAFSGQSFLRLGSSPTDWSATSAFYKSASLARLVADPTSIMAAEGITVAGGSITSTN